MAGCQDGGRWCSRLGDWGNWNGPVDEWDKTVICEGGEAKFEGVSDPGYLTWLGIDMVD